MSIELAPSGVIPGHMDLSKGAVENCASFKLGKAWVGGNDIAEPSPELVADSTFTEYAERIGEIFVPHDPSSGKELALRTMGFTYRLAAIAVDHIADVNDLTSIPPKGGQAYVADRLKEMATLYLCERKPLDHTITSFTDVITENPLLRNTARYISGFYLRGIDWHLQEAYLDGHAALLRRDIEKWQQAKVPFIKDF